MSSTNKDIQQIKYNSSNTIITSEDAAYTEYRYIGSNPNNYVWFNCNEFTGDGSTSWFSNHCEKWRIIGVMDTNTTGENEPLVKIVRSTSIASIPWDKKQSGIGSSVGNGSNDWSDSQLMMVLNPAKYLNQGYRVNSGVLTNTKDIHGREYQVNEETGEVYYTKTDGTEISINSTMYYNQNTDEWAGAYYNKIGSYASSGLKDTTKKFIKPIYWKIGGIYATNTSTESYYKSERGTAVKTTDRPTTWYGEIGLIYPTDFLLGSSSWIPHGYLQDFWTLTPVSSIEYSVVKVSQSGIYGHSQNPTIYQNCMIYPTLYLQPNTLVFGGTGTSSNPYKLML